MSPAAAKKVEQVRSIGDYTSPIKEVPVENLSEKIKDIPVVRDLPDFSNQINSPTAKIFRQEVIVPGYTYGMSTDPALMLKFSTGKGLPGEKEIDCSGAVCKVLKQKGIDRGDPTIGNNAQKFHNDSRPVKVGYEQDGDLITFKVNGDTIDHIGFLVIDQDTGEKFIAESARSFNQGRIVPFKQRIQFLDAVSRKERGKPLEYSIRRL